METNERSWNEFWAYYWRVTQRHTLLDIGEYDRKVVSLVESRCNLSPPARILDLGCGGGDQARIWAEKGYEVVGIDIADALIEYANATFRSAGLKGTFLTADMRDISYRDEFDACTLLSGTFGFFSDPENRALLATINHALRTGGYAFIMYISAHRNDLNQRSWRRISGGYELSEHWFETETSTYCSTVRLIMDDGYMIVPQQEKGYHANERIRCYTPPEIAEMLMEAGFSDTAHLGRKHLDDPHVVLAPWEVRETVVARNGPPADE